MTPTDRPDSERERFEAWATDPHGGGFPKCGWQLVWGLLMDGGPDGDEGYTWPTMQMVFKGFRAGLVDAARAAAPQAQPPYPEGDVAGPCVCGSWPGGKCLRCSWIAAAPERDDACPQCGCPSNGTCAARTPLDQPEAVAWMQTFSDDPYMRKVHFYDEVQPSANFTPEVVVTRLYTASPDSVRREALESAAVIVDQWKAKPVCGQNADYYNAVRCVNATCDELAAAIRRLATKGQS